MSRSRRHFLKYTGAATASLASSGVLAGNQAEAAGIPPTWDKNTDIVIVGSGIAGLCAAIEAADAGARVLMLEKDAQPGGCAKFSGGHMTVAGTDVQARAKVEDKPDWLYADMMEDSETTAVPELIRKYVDGGPEHILWLERLGIKFEERFQSTSNADRISKEAGRGHMIAQSPDYPGGPHEGGLGLIVMLMRAAAKRGVAPLLKHKMTRLIRAERGGVIGVEAETGGTTVAIKASKAVVVTTGGWSGNVRMAIAEDPRITSDIYPDCWPYHLCLGEGHVAAVDVGAELSNMAFGGYLVPRWGTRVYQIWEPQTFATVPSIHTGVPVDFERIILVKADGQRYINERIGEDRGSPANPKFTIRMDSFPNHPFIEAYLNLKERPRNVWAVTGEDGATALWHHYIDQLRNPNPRSGVALYPDMVAISDSLQGLAAKMKVDTAGLQATVSRYNGFVDAQNDRDFGKPAPAHKISGTLFYAVRMALLKHTRRNGIRVNTHGQVLDRADLLLENSAVNSIDNETVIPRLYAAGECANYLGRYHGHGTLGIYSFYGRVAGKNAGAEKALA